MRSDHTWRRWLVRIRDEVVICSQARSVGTLFDELTKGGNHIDIPLSLRYLGTPEVLAIVEQVLAYRRAVMPKRIEHCSITVVIPHYNHSPFLQEALHSLCRQTLPPDEVVVVDDASKDRDAVRKTVRAFEDSLPMKLIENQRRIYPGPTRQVGAEAASGNLIVMHDADDVSHSQRLSLTKEFFASHGYACQLNVGFWSFTQSRECCEPRFSREDVVRNLLGISEIDRDMRRVFSAQKFAVKRPYGIRRGGCGYGTLPPRPVSAGHVAYPTYLVPHLRWSSPEQHTFTRYEDYEFNVLLYLTMRASYELTLPLVGYRRGTTTNIVHP